MPLELSQTLFDDLDKLSEDAANRFCRESRAAISARGRFTVALSGGSTPKALYTKLAAKPYSTQIDWSKVILFVGDERCVPSSHKECNWKMIRESLVDHVPLTESHLFPVQSDESPEEAAAQYGSQLKEHIGDEGFDLVLLGLGPDGHTASLFPAESAIDINTPGATSTHVRHLDSWRVTLTLPEILRAKSIVFLVSGQNKAIVLDEIRRGHTGLPAERVQAGSQKVHWLIDSKAASVDSATRLKREAAEEAITAIKSDMFVGLGTGSTARYVTSGIGRLIHQGKLHGLKCVPTSEATKQLALERRVPLVRLSSVPYLDITIDGADEISPSLELIKGLGGALLREKMVADVSKRFWIVADDSKKVTKLGTKAPVPIAVIPFEWECHQSLIKKFGGTPVLRLQDDGKPVVTDDGCYLIDATFRDGIDDPLALDHALRDKVGIVETGLFLGRAERAFIAASGTVEVIETKQA